MEKKVDEAWKNAVENEKRSFLAQDKTQEKLPDIKPDPQFLQFLQGLGMQALMMVEESETDQAKFLIDSIRSLQKKTKNNLAKEEESFLQNLVYELEMKFVEHTQKKTP